LEKSDSYKEKLQGITDVNEMAKAGLNIIDNMLSSNVLETQSDQNELSDAHLSDI
jgi:hypothetical protein